MLVSLRRPNFPCDNSFSLYISFMERKSTAAERVNAYPKSPWWEESTRTLPPFKENTQWNTLQSLSRQVRKHQVLFVATIFKFGLVQGFTAQSSLPQPQKCIMYTAVWVKKKGICLGLKREILIKSQLLHALLPKRSLSSHSKSTAPHTNISHRVWREPISSLGPRVWVQIRDSKGGKSKRMNMGFVGGTSLSPPLCTPHKHTHKHWTLPSPPIVNKVHDLKIEYTESHSTVYLCINHHTPNHPLLLSQWWEWRMGQTFEKHLVVII